MLPSQFRLNPQSIPIVARKGRLIYASELFHIKVLADTTGCFFAISVGLKVSKKAVVRNRIKRMFRAAIRQILSVYADKLPKGQYLIVARSEQLFSSSSEELFELLKNSISH